MAPGYQRGEVVNVLYAPDDPNNARIDAGLMNWFGPAMLLLMGALFTVVGATVLRRCAQARKQQKDIELEL